MHDVLLKILLIATILVVFGSIATLRGRVANNPQAARTQQQGFLAFWKKHPIWLLLLCLIAIGLGLSAIYAELMLGPAGQLTRQLIVWGALVAVAGSIFFRTLWSLLKRGNHPNSELP